MSCSENHRYAMAFVPYYSGKPYYSGVVLLAYHFSTYKGQHGREKKVRSKQNLFILSYFLTREKSKGNQEDVCAVSRGKGGGGGALSCYSRYF